MSVERIDLAPGYSISRLLKGGWQLAGGHGAAVDRRAAVDDMRRFVAAGITTLDCADIYTGVEDLIGEFLARYRRDRGASADVQVHTKYVPDLESLARLTRDDVRRTIDRSLARLGVPRLDLVQFHWWDYDVPGYVQAAQWLDELRRDGKIHLIGATNFDTPRLTEILDAGVPIVSHQVQYSLLDRRPEHGMAALAQSRGFSLLCYGSLAGGFLSGRYLGVQAPAEPFENRSLTKYRLIIDEFGGWPAFQHLLAAVDTIGRRHGVSPGAVALRWTLDRPQVAGVIVGARHARHLQDTLAAASLRLDQEDLAVIDAVIGVVGGPAGDTFGLERTKGGRHATIMKYNLNRI